jgi:dihydroflavonol-4-reductase
LPDKVLVTGSTGFVGSALCRLLAAQGYSVRAFHRPSSSLSALDAVPAEHVTGDILAPETLPPAMEGSKWVFHVAAESAYWRRPHLVTRAAVEGTRNIVRAAARAGCSRLILTSSVGALGVPEPGRLLDESHEFNLPPGRFPYGHAKWISEKEALQAAGSELEIVIVNPSIVMGAGDLNRISGSMVIEAARGKTFLYTDGGANYIHIEDVAAGHIAAAQRGRAGERYLLGNENLSHRQVFAMLAQIVGRRSPWLRIPPWGVEPMAISVATLSRIFRLPISPDQIRMSRHSLFCDLTKAQRELGFTAIRSFRQAAVDAYEWYRARGEL